MKLHTSHMESMRGVAIAVGLLVIGAVLAVPFSVVSSLRGIANYLPLHMLFETIAIVVSMLIFAVGWHAYNRNLPGNIVLLACAFFGVGLLDFAHMLSYAGMPDFVTPNNVEKGIDFWLAARSLAAVALLAVVVMPWRPFASTATRYKLLSAVIAATAFAYWLILTHQEALPCTFIPGQGLTAFKIGSEYAIIALNLAAAFVLRARMSKPLPFNAAALFGALCAMALSELFFTLYASVTDVFNLMGHVYKVIAYLFLYRTFFVATIDIPFSQLQLSKSKLHGTLDAIPDLVWLKDADGVFLECNPAFERLLGARKADIVGKTDYDFVEKELADFFREHDRKAMAAGKPSVNEERLTFAEDGYCGLFETIKTPMRDDTGSLIGVLGIARDITGRKQAERALKESEEKFHRLFEDAADPVLLLKDGQFVDCNAATLKLLGYGIKDEFLNRRPSEISPPCQPDGRASAEKSAEMDATALREGFHQFEWLHTRADGSAVPVEVTLTAITVDERPILHVLWRDITERKQAEAALQDSENRFRALVESTSDWIWEVDENAAYTYASPRIRDILGYEAPEVIGKTPFDFMPPEEVERVAAVFGQMVAARKPLVNLENINTHKDGRRIFLETSGVPVIDKEGKFRGYRGVDRDITERKRAEDTQRKLYQVVEQSPSSIVITDTDANIEYVNRAFVNETGYSLAEAMGKNPRVLNSGKNSEKTYREMWSCLKRGEAWRGELVNRRKDGSEYVELAVISPVRLDDGSVTNYLAIKENITARKADEAKIERLGRTYRLLSRVNEAIVRAPDKNLLFEAVCHAAGESGLFRLAWIGMADKDEHRVIPMACSGIEDGYLSMLDIRFDDETCLDWPIPTAIRENTHVIRQDIENIPHLAPWREEALKRGLQSAGMFPIREMGVVSGTMNVYSTDKDFFAPDIVRLMLELTADISFALDVFADRQRRESAEEEIRQMNVELEYRVQERTRQLEDANKELEAFSYSVSHDLRAPLRSIDGFSRTLSKKYHDQLDATGRDWLERVCRASQHMGHLIDDMLKLSQVTRGTLRREQVDLSKMAGEVADGLRKTNPERQVRFIVQQGMSVQADPGLLHIVLDNLLGNAWKYSGKKIEAEIEFGVCDIKPDLQTSPSDLQSDLGEERAFFVRDNGAGFNMEYAGKLFGAFQRLHTANEFDGTGIGLATVQRIVHRHNGKVWAEGKEGQGATFYFTLPQRERGGGIEKHEGT